MLGTASGRGPALEFFYGIEAILPETAQSANVASDFSGMSERDAELFASSQFNNPKSADVIVNVRFRTADCGRFYAHSDILREAARYFALQSDAALEMVCPTMPSLRGDDAAI